MPNETTQAAIEAAIEKIAAETGGSIDQIDREWAIELGGATISPSQTGKSFAGWCQADHEAVRTPIARAAEWLREHASHE